MEAVPRGLLFWRSFIQWLGGMGIIVLSVAILPSPGVAACSFTRPKSQSRRRTNSSRASATPRGCSGSIRADDPGAGAAAPPRRHVPLLPRSAMP
ncbi:MAG: hypothetical protein U5J82_06500 [Desulfobacterales bacterium]|nr:hypothetical protein [Desulfobacterales bacterium]